MKINRLQALAHIDAMLMEQETNWDADQARMVTSHREKVKAWRGDEAKRLAAVLRELADKAAKGQPVTENDIEDATGTTYSARRDQRSLVWSGDQTEPKPRPWPGNVKLTRLRVVLAASPDEDITTSALREFGVQPAAFLNGGNA